jgi:arginine:ornithine antiporter/lysine permease
VIVTGTADLKTFILGVGLFFAGFVIYPFLTKYMKKQDTGSTI